MIPAWEQDWWGKRTARAMNELEGDDSYQWIVREGQRYDCRKLDAGFLLDTGAEALVELDAGHALLHQGANICVYQFADCTAYVSSCSYGTHILGKHETAKEFLNSETVPHLCVNVQLPGDPFPDDSDEMFDHEIEIWDRPSWEKLVANGVQDGEYKAQMFCGVGDGPDDGRDDGRLRAATMALGLLALMDERLLRQRTVAGSTLTKNARRLNEGRAPLLPYRIVTLNLAETRRRTRSIALHQHESPRLHWRRGHWRVIGRMSEFERRTWIKRMLVGDPDKGFVQKHYRTIWTPTIH